MQLIHHVDINFLTAFILSLVSIIAFIRLNHRDKLSKTYLVMSAIIIIQLILEAFSVILDNQTTFNMIWLRFSISFVIFIIGPFLAMMWFMLIKKMFVPKMTVKPITKLIVYLPQIINVILVISTIFFDTVFYIDEFGVYHRGHLFFLTMILTYYYIVLTFILILSNRKKVVKEDLLLLAVATALPVLGGILQGLFYGLLLIWPSVGFSLIILYLFLQQRVIHHDYLTNAWSRESFFQFISFNMESSKKPFGVIYFDLDNLKTVNDQYGHEQGDFALKKTVEIVKKSLPESIIVARLGGDEFIGIFSATTQKEVVNVVTRIRYNINQYNEEKRHNYPISISIGYGLFDQPHDQFEAFISKLDQDMYADKKSKEDE